MVNGYDWLISSAACEKGSAIGIKRNDGGRSVTCVDSLNAARNKLNLYWWIRKWGEYNDGALAIIESILSII